MFRRVRKFGVSTQSITIFEVIKQFNNIYQEKLILMSDVSVHEHILRDAC